MSDKIVIDLTQNLANVGESIAFQSEVSMDDGLLPYPNAHLVKVLLNFDVTFVKPNVSVVGTITCVIDGYCDKCLANITKAIELPFNQIFYKDGSQGEDDYAYSDSKLDAIPLIIPQSPNSRSPA